MCVCGRVCFGVYIAHGFAACFILCCTFAAKTFDLWPCSRYLRSSIRYRLLIINTSSYFCFWFSFQNYLDLFFWATLFSEHLVSAPPAVCSPVRWKHAETVLESRSSQSWWNGENVFGLFLLLCTRLHSENRIKPFTAVITRASVVLFRGK